MSCFSCFSSKRWVDDNEYNVARAIRTVNHAVATSTSQLKTTNSDDGAITRAEMRSQKMRSMKKEVEVVIPRKNLKYDSEEYEEGYSEVTTEKQIHAEIMHTGYEPRIVKRHVICIPKRIKGRSRQGS